MDNIIDILALMPIFSIYTARLRWTWPPAAVQGARRNILVRLINDTRLGQSKPHWTNIPGRGSQPCQCAHCHHSSVHLADPLSICWSSMSPLLASPEHANQHQLHTLVCPDLKALVQRPHMHCIKQMQEVLFTCMESEHEMLS